MSLPTTVTLARTALYAGLLAGALDIAAAILTNLQVPARVVLQSVAGGWLGAGAYRGGWATAWLGLASHFAIMLIIAAVYVALAARAPGLNRIWLAAGIAWGIAVWVVMTFAVVPLSAATLPPPDRTAALKGLAIHILFVGLPIAWVTRRMPG